MGVPVEKMRNGGQIPRTFLLGFFICNGATYLSNFFGMAHTWLILKSKER